MHGITKCITSSNFNSDFAKWLLKQGMDKWLYPILKYVISYAWNYQMYHLIQLKQWLC